MISQLYLDILGRLPNDRGYPVVYYYHKGKKIKNIKHSQKTILTFQGGSQMVKATVWARIIATSVILFPVITVSAAFPLNMLPLADTLLQLLPAPDPA